MKKFKRVLVITICGILGGLLAGIVSFGKLSNEGPFIDIILSLLFGGIIGLSFGMGSELMQNKGMLIKTFVRTIMRGLFCLIISLVLFGIFYILSSIWVGSVIELMAFAIMITIHILFAMTLGISLGVEITRKMPYLLRGIGGIIGGIMLIPLAGYIFRYVYYELPFQVYLLGSLIGLSITIGSVISERRRISER